MILIIHVSSCAPNKRPSYEEYIRNERTMKEKIDPIKHVDIDRVVGFHQSMDMQAKGASKQEWKKIADYSIKINRIEDAYNFCINEDLNEVIHYWRLSDEIYTYYEEYLFNQHRMYLVFFNKNKTIKSYLVN